MANSEVLNLIGISLPLITIAGTAVAYVIKIYTDSNSRRRNEFFELLRLLDEKDTLASKVAAAYQLRDFPEHAPFIIRFCESAIKNTFGPAADDLRAEFQSTLDHFTKN